jgi:hypothetical protein
MKYCTFCKPKRVKAIYRDCYLNLACEKHKNRLIHNDDRFIEADYQTWFNL